MKNTLSNIAMFVAGAAVGSVATWFVLKKRYDALIQEEIDSVKEAFSGKVNYVEDQDETAETEVDDVLVTNPNEKPDIREYAAKIRESQYTDYTTNQKPMSNNEGVLVVDDSVHVIAPEEYGERDGYETISLTYFADGVLTDDQDVCVEDVAGTVGSNFDTHFGEYEDDSVFVRNDRLKADFEILADPRKYSDVANTKTHPTEDE